MSGTSGWFFRLLRICLAVLILVALAAAFWPLTRRPATAVSAGHDQEPALAGDKAA